MKILIAEHAKLREQQNSNPVPTEDDPRDWIKEALEEIADAWNYLGYESERTKNKERLKELVILQVYLGLFYEKLVDYKNDITFIDET